MSRRRRAGGTGGVGVTAGALAGAAWRQQQQLAALAAALQRLPAAEALPAALLRALQKVLLLVEHVVHGIPAVSADGADDGGDDDGDIEYEGAALAAVGLLKRSSASVPRPFTGEDRWLPPPAAAAEAATGAVLGAGGGGATAAAVPLALRQQAAAAQAAEMLRGIAATGGGVQGAASGLKPENGDPWNSERFTVALLHHLLVLSSDLFDAPPGGSDNLADMEGEGEDAEQQHGKGADVGCAAVHGGNGPSANASASDGDGGGLDRWPAVRDDLAAASRRRLPAAVYGRILAILGWEAHLADLLAWIPDPRVRQVVLERVVRAWPGAAAGLAAVAAPENGDDAVVQSVWRPGDLGRLVLSSPGVLRGLGEAVLLEAAARPGGEGGGAAGVAEGDGRRWLPCLLLLARALVAELKRDLEIVADGGSGSGRSGNSAVAEQSGHGRHHEGAAAAAVGWAAACCDALQEGLCAWQAAIFSAAAASTCRATDAGAAGTADAAPRGLPAPSTSAADANADAAAPGASRGCAGALLRLLQHELLGLLDELGRRHIAAQEQHPPAQRPEHDVAAAAATLPPPSPLLPYANVIRLRSRIALLQLTAAAAAAAAPTVSAAEVVSTAQGATGTGTPPPFCHSGSHAAVNPMVPDDVWPDRPAASVTYDNGLLPGWLRAATCPAAAAAAPRTLGQVPYPPAVSAVLTAGSVPSRLQSPQLLSHPHQQQHQQHSGDPVMNAAAVEVEPAAAASTVSSVAAVAVALLTPGVTTWLQAPWLAPAAAAAGPAPYSPFRVALALLELLQAALGGCAGEDSNLRSAPSKKQAGPGRVATAPPTALRALELRVLRMSVECVRCVEAAAQQSALQAVVAVSSGFSRLRNHLAADVGLQAAAGRALVALSNRAAAVEASLDHTALSAQQEAQHLAAAARDLLPYAVLAPRACVRRLVLDGLTHPGQLPWVLQLLWCFATVVTGAASVPVSVPALPPPSLLVLCLRDILQGGGGGAAGGDGGSAASRGPAAPAPPLRLLRSAADRRALLGLVDGLVRAGLLAPRQVLSQLVAPALGGAAEAEAMDAGCEQAAAWVPQALSSLLLAQHVLQAAAEAAAAAVGHPSHSLAATELAAARPARLLLAAARTWQRLCSLYDSSHDGPLEAAAIDAAAGVLERGVEVYAGYLLAAAVAGTLAMSADAAELRELYDGAQSLSRRALVVLLPLLEISLALPYKAASEAIPQRDSATAAADRGRDAAAAAAAEGEEDDDEAAGARSRALASRLAPAALWRPRSLRAADARTAHDILYDTLALAASSAEHALAVQREMTATALEEEDEAEEEQDERMEAGSKAAGAVEPTGTLSLACDAAWTTWGGQLLLPSGGPEPATAGPSSAPAAGAPAGLRRLGTLVRHAAGTAARGLPQLPPARLLEGTISALAALLPTASADQASRLLLVTLPALARNAADGAAKDGSAAASLWPDLRTELYRCQLLGSGACGAEGEALVPFWEPLPKGAGAAADVAATVALAGRAAEAALRRAAAPGGGTVGGDRAVNNADSAAVKQDLGVRVVDPVPGPGRLGRLTATAERCASHLAMLATRVGGAAAAAVQRPEQQLLPAACVEPRLLSQERPGAAATERVAVASRVLLVLVAELCAVAAAAVQLAADAGAGAEAQARALDVWQAIILSALESLVVLMPSEVEAPGWEQAVLRTLRRVLSVLPPDQAAVLWGAVERLREERAHEAAQAAGPAREAAAARGGV